MPKDGYGQKEICCPPFSSSPVHPVESHSNFWPTASPTKCETFGGIIKWSVANQNLSNWKRNREGSNIGHKRFFENWLKSERLNKKEHN